MITAFISALVFAAFLGFMVWTSIKRRRDYLNDRMKNTWGNLSLRDYSLEEFEKLSHYYKRRADRDGMFHIDDQTWFDLDMDYVYRRINQCVSPAGEEYFYYLLRTPDLQGDRTEQIVSLAEFYRKHEDDRKDILSIFYDIRSKKRTAFADFLNLLDDTQKEHPLFDYVSFGLLIISIFVFLIKPKSGLFPLLVIVILNIFTYLKKKGDIGFRFGSITQIVDLINCSKKVYDKMPVDQVIFQPLKEKLEEELAALKPVVRYGWLLSSKENSGDFISVMLDYFCMVTHLDLICYNLVSGIIEKDLRTVEELFESAGTLEVSLSVGSFYEFLNNRGGYCKPFYLGIRENNEIIAMDVRHPLLRNPVSNSIDGKRSVLITGSNASGKSTFLRTIGLNVLLCETIGCAAASQFRMQHYRLFSSMSVSDNLKENESYFMAESKMLKRITEASEGVYPVLALLDEVLKGTNTLDRIAASSKILDDLNKRNIIIFAATHDLELTHLLNQGFDNYHFEETMEGNDISFSYKLKKGRASTRNAMKLLLAMGYDEQVIHSAEQMADHYIDTGVWSLS